MARACPGRVYSTLEVARSQGSKREEASKPAERRTRRRVLTVRLPPPARASEWERERERGSDAWGEWKPVRGAAHACRSEAIGGENICTRMAGRALLLIVSFAGEKRKRAREQSLKRSQINFRVCMTVRMASAGSYSPTCQMLRCSEPSMAAQQMIQDPQHPAFSSSSSPGDPEGTIVLRRFFLGKSSACGAYARMERCTMVDAAVGEGTFAGNESSAAHIVSMRRRREAQTAGETYYQASPRPAGSSRDTICANTTAQAVVRPANLRPGPLISIQCNVKNARRHCCRSHTGTRSETLGGRATSTMWERK